MPGLLDMFSSGDDSQTHGLLAAAAQLLKSGGPSLMPISTGQALGNAYLAYDDATNAFQDRQQKMAQAKQMDQLRGLQIQDAQGTLADQQRARDHAEQLRQFYADWQKNGGPVAPQAQSSTMPSPGAASLPDGMASALPGGPMSPKIGGPDWLQAYQASRAGGAPAPAVPQALPIGQGSPRIAPPDWMQSYQAAQSGGQTNPDGQTPAIQMDGGTFYRAAQAAGLPTDTSTLNQFVGAANNGQAPAPAPASLGTRSTSPTSSAGLANDPYQQRMDLANSLRAHGFNAEADAQEAAALKFKPKFSTEFRPALGPDGKLHNYVLSDDGAPPKDTGLGVKPNVKVVDLGGSQQFYDENTITPGTSFKKTPTPGEVLSSQGGDAPALTDSAIENAARRYLIDGTLPPMGMGSAGTQGRAAILNKAAELGAAAGVSGDQQRRDQLDNKSKAAARTATLRDFSPAGKSGQALTAANTALNHLDTVRQLAQAQANNDTPSFNRLANAWAQATGNPAPTNLQAAITMVAPEVSKAVIGAAGGQEERAQFAKNFNPNGSPQQILQGIGTIEDLLGGRLTESRRSYERGTGQSDFSQTMLSPAAQQVLARAQQRSASATPQGAPAAPGQFSIKAPNGKTYTFTNAKDLANFKLTSGLQ